MRYELADYEWAAIKPMLPNKPRGVPRVNDRRVLSMASSGSCDPEHPGAIYRKRLVPLQPLRSRQRGPELKDAACAITKNACEAGNVYPAIGVAKELTSRERTVAFNGDSVLGYFEAEHKRPPTDAAEHHLLKILPLAAELLAQLWIYRDCDGSLCWREPVV